MRHQKNVILTTFCLQKVKKIKVGTSVPRTFVFEHLLAHYTSWGRVRPTYNAGTSHFLKYLRFIFMFFLDGCIFIDGRNCPLYGYPYTRYLFHIVFLVGTISTVARDRHYGVILYTQTYTNHTQLSPQRMQKEQWRHKNWLLIIAHCICLN